MMSSSSSATDFGYYQYGYDWPMMPMNSPTYSYMRQPVQVYYAHVPPRRQRNDKKGNPNCFIKAFRWYTQEHFPPKQDTVTDQKVVGFATWLDSKYEQYLRENKGQDDLAQTSFLDTDDYNSDACRPCSLQPKKHKLKRPWKRQPHSSNKRHTEDETKKYQSMEYILSPKNLSCPASECCRFTTMIDVSDKKIAIKSQSEVNVCPNGNKPIDLVKTQEGIGIRSTSKDKIDVSNKIQNPEGLQNKPSKHNDDKSCQISAGNVIKVDAWTQYDISDVTRVASANTVAATHCTCDVTTVPKSQHNSLFGKRKKHSDSRSSSKKSSKDFSGPCQCFPNGAHAQTQYSYCVDCECPDYYENSVLFCKNKLNRSTCKTPSPRQATPVSSTAVLSEKSPVIRKCSISCPSKAQPAETQILVPITETVETKISRFYTTASQTSDHPISLEHFLQKHDTGPDQNIAGFVTWLDGKYEDYVRDSKGQDGLTQTSPQGPDDFNSILSPEVSDKKIFIKSQSTVNVTPNDNKPVDLVKIKEVVEIRSTSNQKIDICYKVQSSEGLQNESKQNDNKSCQLFSENVTKVETGTLCNSSNVNWVASTSMVATPVSAHKSRSDSQSCNKKRQSDSRVSSKKSLKDLGTKSTSESGSCQCFPNAAHAPAQYSRCVDCECPDVLNHNNQLNRRTCKSLSLRQETLLSTMAVLPEKSSVIRKCSISCPSKAQPAESQILVPTTETVETKISRGYTINVNNVTQTSDHPINLEANNFHKYPLFMRIVCADKPCDECAQKCHN